MVAAIYARKSTEQHGFADEQKSVARQIDHARAYAQARGWTVPDEFVYVDDGISGAEFAGRPGFVRLMTALKPKPPFDVLVMSEESRLGREAIETAYALKQLITAGVRVWFYLEDRERTLASPSDKLLLSVTAFADELEREKARQRTYDAMVRKAKAGHVTGGRVFGYDNREILGPDGCRQRVERVVNDAEAAVVRRIFTLCGDGVGKSRIAKILNADRAPSPRAQQGRPRAWAPSSVHEVLHRPLYRGELFWNQTRKRDKWGKVSPTARPPSEWLRIPVPHLRIITDEQWSAAQNRLASAKAAYLQATNGRAYGRPRDLDSKYLLPGLARCTHCNGGLIVRSRAHGKHRAHFYACGSYHQRGRTVCGASREVQMFALDELVLDRISSVFSTDVLDAAVEKAAEVLRSDRLDRRVETLDADLRSVEVEIHRLTNAIAKGGALDSLVEAVRSRQQQAEALRATMAQLSAAGASEPDWGAVRNTLRRLAGDWRSLLRGQISQARQILKKVIAGPVLVALDAEPLSLHGEVTLRPLISEGDGLPRFLASPTGFEPVF